MNKYGLTLMEMLIAMALLSLIMVGSSSYMRQVKRYRLRNEVISEMTLVARQQIEALRNDSSKWKQIGEYPLEISSRYPMKATVQIEPSAFSNKVQKMDCIVMYQDLYWDEKIVMSAVRSVIP